MESGVWRTYRWVHPSPRPGEWPDHAAQKAVRMATATPGQPVAVVGKRGTGKNMVVQRMLAILNKMPEHSSAGCVTLDPEQPAVVVLSEASLRHITGNVVFLPHIGRYKNAAAWFMEVSARAAAVVATVWPQELAKWREHAGGMAELFETVHVQEPDDAELHTLLIHWWNMTWNIQLANEELTFGPADAAMARRLATARASGLADPGRTVSFVGQAVQHALVTPGHVETSMTNMFTRYADFLAGTTHATIVCDALKTALRRQLPGQEAATTAIYDSVMAFRLGLMDPVKPLALMLHGDSGTGKTKTAELVARHVFSSPDRLVVIPCNQYTQAQEVARLTGAPPGYVGYASGGQLIDPVEQFGQCAILLDEIEKAHPNFWRTILNLLDRGYMVSNTGRQVSFKGCVVMMTSNLPSKDSMLEHFQAPEFIGRIYGFVPFRALLPNDGALPTILDMLIGEQAERFRTATADPKAELSIDEKARAFLLQQMYDPRTGVRSLANGLTTHVMPLLVACLRQPGGRNKAEITHMPGADTLTLLKTDRRPEEAGNEAKKARLASLYMMEVGPSTPL
jgi:DNA polymerase III delta prime subunit